jgi:hypothetical protein
MLPRLWLVFVILIAAISAPAQVGGGTISGTVSDPGAAVVPGAEVSIENIATHEVRHIATSSTGLFSAPNLTPGTYRVTVTAPGFSTWTRPGIEVQVGGEAVLRAELQVGAAADTIVVHEEMPAVDTASSAIEAVNTGSTVRELPLNGRDWTTLAALQPGVAIVRTQAGVGLNTTRGNRGLGTQMAVGGARPQQNNYRLDGVSVNDYAGSGPASVLGISLGVDAIEQFSVVSGNPTADYGKTSGGVINAVSRSGTNQIHGSAYEFLRNSALDARNFFDPTKAPPFKRNQFGASFGGPIRHDKTFFFADYEGLRQSLGVTTVDTVPSPNARVGHMANGSTLTVSPKVAPYLTLYPLPNGAINGDTGIYSFAAQDVTNEDFFTVRGDHHFSDRDILHGTFLKDDGQSGGPDTYNFTLLGTQSRRTTANAEESHLFTPTSMNFLRFGFNRMVADQVKSLSAINPASSDSSLGFIPGRAVGQMNVTGLTSFTGGMGAQGEYQFHYNSYQLYDDFSLTRGSHSLKIGGSLEKIESNELGGGSLNGTAAFGSLTNFLTNVPTSFTATVPGTGTPLGLRQWVAGGYVQDDWRARRNLTFNLGLRYEMSSVPGEQHGRIATLTSFSSPQIHLGSPYFSNPTRRDFSPRLGVAWDPFGDGKSSIRAAFGVYDSLPLTYEFALLSVLVAPYNEQGSSATVPAGSFPDHLYQSISAGALRTGFIEQKPKRNYVEQWNLTVQRQLASSLTAELGYAGTHGVHSPFLTSDVNTVPPSAASPLGYIWPTPRGSGVKPFPTLGSVTAIFWQVSSTYHALRARVTRSFKGGFQMQTSYTWSKSLDTGSDSFQTAFTNSISVLPLYDTSIRHSYSNFDIRHVLSVNGTWEIPGGVRSQPAALLLKGWRLGTIVQAASGLPFTPQVGGDPLGLLTTITTPYAFPDRLDLPSCGNPVNPGNPVSYIKLSCFAAPFPATRMGDAGRNVAIGPGLVNLDFSLFKSFPVHSISETANVQFRAEMFNILNQTNFSPPTSNSAQIFTQALALVPSAGNLTSTSTTSRQIQFALKIVW